MDAVPKTNTCWARVILAISAGPLVLLTAVKCLLLNAAWIFNAHWPMALQQSWLARAEILWATVLAGCAILLCFVERRYGYLAIAALLASAVFWILTPAIQ